MFDRLSKTPSVLNVPWFWIWRDCICKRYIDFWKCLNMAQYASIMSEYTSICLSTPKFDWPLLNIAECFRVCLEMPEKTVLTMSGFSIYLIILYIWQGFEYALVKYAWVLIMPWYSCNNIIISSNAIIQYFNSCLLDLYSQALRN